MALEYILVDPGSGRKVATDQYTQGADVLDVQVVKIAHGADGALDGCADELTPLPVNQRQAGTVITVTPTVSTTPAYASGDAVGGKLTLPNAVRLAGGVGIIRSIVLTDKGKQNAAIDVVVFRADPTATTFTDNAALSVADADLLSIAGVVSVAAADYAAFVDNSVATKSGLGLAVNSITTTLYACLVTRGTPTYTASSDLQLTVVIEQY